MNSKPRRKYDSDFKRNAVLLCAEPERSVPEVANSLGIRREILYRWRREYYNSNGNNVFTGNGNQAFTEEQKQIRELKKKLKNTEIERDILKKAMAIFSRTSK